MITKSQAEQFFKDYTNTGTAHVALGNRFTNESIRYYTGLRNWPFLEKSYTITITAGEGSLPNDLEKLVGVYHESGGFKYIPKEVTSREEWDYITSTSATSSYPEYFYIYAGKIQIYPEFDTSGTCVVLYKKKTKDLSISDTNGTATVTNGSTTVSTTNTTLGSAMIGRYIIVREAQNGDHNWYEIQQVPSTSTLTLVSPYQGNTVTATCTIGQVIPLPETYQELPILRASEKFWRVLGQNTVKANEFKREADELEARLITDYSNKTTSPVIQEGLRSSPPLNPNLNPTIN